MFARARNPIRMMFTDTCTITTRTEILNDYGIAEWSEVVLATDEPCRLSFSTIKETNQTDFENLKTQVVKLFIREDMLIPTGSLIAVTRGGITTEYDCSGECARYNSHQEIVLKLKEVHA